jgi:hypothetical protein
MTTVAIVKSISYTQLTATILPAVAALVIVHRAVLSGFLAALRRGFGRKRARAYRRHQDR